MKRFHLNAFGAVLLAGLAFTSCKKSNFENNNPEAAGLMAVNLADKTVEMGINGNALGNAPLAFNTFTGGYLSIFPGQRSVEAYDYATGDSVAAASFDFVAKNYYTSFIVGSDGTYQNVIVHDNFDSLSASSGKAYVRYINGIAGSTNPSVTITAGGSNVVNANAAFASVSDFVAVDPGDISIAVSEGSTINANRTISVTARNVYTILLSPGATSSETAQIKFIHNGTLDEEVGAEAASSAEAVTIQ